MACVNGLRSNFHGLENRTLDRQEAEARIKRLTPGSEEHSRLQTALLITSGIAEICLPNVSYKVNLTDEKLLGGFGSSEHIAIAEAVELKGLVKHEPLMIKGLCRIQFHHIVALAGDFYGVAGQAISLPGGEDEQKAVRFLNASNTLVNANNDEVRKIIQELESECFAVAHSSLPQHCYSHQVMEKNHAIKKIKADVDELLIDNSDHFSVNAEEAYRIGHALAIKTAAEAGKQNDPEGLKRAYVLEAFACHFLTDLFAAGHIRNQRGQLETFLINELKLGPTMAKKGAGILTGAQHEKDGNDGLHVRNELGDQWRAYGDGCFFTPKNKENKEKAIFTLQCSIDEVYASFKNPSLPITSTMDKRIPHATKFNPFPLYAVDADCKKLTLYLNNDERILTKDSGIMEYVNQGILTQALRYLPESYVLGFIGPHFELPPVLKKVALPMVEQLTGTVWHMVGLAGYYQVKKETAQINQKLDEMADGIKAIYDITSETLQNMKAALSLLQAQSWADHYEELKVAIVAVKDVLYQHTAYSPDKLTEDQQKQISKKMWEAHVTLARVFTSGTAEDKSIFPAYISMLKTRHQVQDPLEIKLRATRWMRRMVSFQITAFSMYVLYASMQLWRSNNNTDKSIINGQIRTFEKSLIKQIELNQHYIEAELIFDSENYITLQIDKLFLQREALHQFLK